MNKFLRAYTELENKIKENKELVSETEIFGLLGSVADKEESNTWSDLDVLIVLKANELGSISISTLKKFKKITEEVSKRYSFTISILPHTEDDFKNYVCFEYLKHYSHGKITYTNKSSLKELVFKILEGRKVDERVRRSYYLYHLRHTRFNFIRKYVSINKHNSKEPSREICKLLIEKMVKATDLALNYYDKWPKTKQSILIEAEKYLKVDTSLLRKALNIRMRWNKVSEREAKKFIPKGIKYLHGLVENILEKENNRSTPEEIMSLK